ncbi:hypothetical protein MOBT1_003343 [Malassezia obtusa]|uniref:ATP11-domain-containing protein n=1 Tax=Malassezia obtusa TaxID=76774 RepID=A0AAF0E2V6_9BASI|nr:hypothetical protein MOBT1_003343 [Malassezia obtusa]
MFALRAVRPLRIAAPLRASFRVRTYASDADSLLDRLTKDAAPGETVEDKRRAKFDQYNQKLAAKAQERGLDSVEELAKKHREEEVAKRKQEREERARAYADQVAAETAAKQGSVEERDLALQERLRLRREQEEARKLQSDMGESQSGPVKPLSSFLDVEKIKQESPENITKLWAGYHTLRGKLSAVIPASTYTRLIETARKYPQFVIPLPKTESVVDGEAESAFEMQFLQWAFLARPTSVSTASAPPSAVLYTSLAEYKLRQEFAQPALVLTHYTDLVESKGIVLMRGDVTERQTAESDEVKQVISQKEAQLLALCTQRFYNMDWSQHPSADEELRRELLRTFHQDPEAFSLEKLLEASFKFG